MMSPLRRKKTRGFTLLEMAVVLVIVGVMVGMISRTQSSVQPSGCYVETKKQLETIRDAVNSFVANNNRLPAPARRDQGVRDAGYGREIDPTVPAQLATIDRYATGTPASTNPVLFGALPFQSLGLPESYASDCWGNKFTFVVTQALTSSSSSGGYGDATAPGGITIKSSSAVTVADAAASPSEGMNWAVISHGENGQKSGGVERNWSTNKGWCSSTAVIETENCEVGNITLMDALFNNGANAGNNYFDDLIIYGSRKTVPPGNLYCWGRGLEGQLGNGTTSDSNVPVAATTPAGVKYFTKLFENAYPVGAEQSMCAIGDDNNAYCWGRLTGYNGTQRTVPTLVTIAGKTINEIAFGSNIWAVTTDGNTYRWWFGAWQAMNKPGGQDVTDLATGPYHACVLQSSGRAYCSGANWSGQLGDAGNTDNNTTTFSMVNMNASWAFTNISVGYDHSCAINIDGNAYCWGEGGSGQLGRGNNNDYNTPQLVTKPGGVDYWVDLTAGSAVSCYLANTGSVYCTGANNDGQGGRGGVAAVNIPTITNSFPVGVKATHLSGSGYHMCAHGDDGKIYCWGSAGSGQIGHGSSPFLVGAPTAANFPSGVTEFTTMGTTGNGTCALTSPPPAKGQLFCWGANWGAGYWQLGDGTSNDRFSPAPVTKPGAVTSWLDVAGEGYATCAIGQNGLIYCWGNGEGTGGTERSTPTAVPLPAGKTFTKIWANGDAFCAIDGTPGDAYCWYHTGSQPATASTPATGAVTMPPGVKFTQIDMAYDYTGSTFPWTTHICALGDNGQAYCWGSNKSEWAGGGGQLGDGTNTNRANPTLVANGAKPAGVKYTQIATGDFFTCAIGDNGKGYCWGDNEYAIYGDGYWSPTQWQPYEITFPAGVTSFTDVAAGQNSVCWIGNNNNTYCVGHRTGGKLGNGFGDSSVDTSPQLVKSIGSPFTKLYAKSSALYMCGVAANKKAYCWGYNQHGQLGHGGGTSNIFDGTTQPVMARPFPVDMPGTASTFSKMAIMPAHACAVSN